MTAEQMKYEFEVGYDRITNFDAPGYLNKEISTFLTQAQEELVLDIYRNGADYKEEHRRAISKINRTDTLNGFAAGRYPNGEYDEIASDVLVILNEFATVVLGADHEYYGKFTDDEVSNVKVIPVGDDYIFANINNPHKKPGIRPDDSFVWRVDYGDDTHKYVEYITDGDFTMSQVDYIYIMKPDPIIIEDANYVAADGEIDGVAWNAYVAAELPCALDPIVHRLIVDRAVRLAYAALQDEKGYQIQSIEESKQQKV